MKATWYKYDLQFKQPAGTSRGILNVKQTYFLVVEYEGFLGIGECGILRGLSYDDRPDYESKLDFVCQNIALGFDELYDVLYEYPSIQFGLEMAFAGLESGNPFVFFDNLFAQGKSGILTNGLIWMGEASQMQSRIEEKINDGYKCLKMKIGAIDWREELRLLKSIRTRFSPTELEIRVDANGGFSPEAIRSVLDELANLNVHSIEQPIAKGQWNEMAKLCRETPVPIALDEELIGLNSVDERDEMMATILPQYIILKPSFIGGWMGSEDWIARASGFGSKWWVTSALESNIGLNAIAQWTAELDQNIPQGLGTGGLYLNNIDSPLIIDNARLWSKGTKWKVDQVLHQIRQA